MTVPDDVVESLLEEILYGLDIEPGDETDAQERQLRRRIGAAASKVLLSLNRDSFTTVAEARIGLRRDVAYQFADMRAWPETVGTFSDRAAYEFHIANTDDPEVYDVTFQIGLSLLAPDSAPIRDYIVADVLESLLGHTLFPTHAQRVTSVSGGGQSISFEKRASSSDAAGGTLTLDSLRRFKRYNVGTSITTNRAPWPYGSGV